MSMYFLKETIQIIRDCSSNLISSCIPHIKVHSEHTSETSTAATESTSAATKPMAPKTPTPDNHHYNLLDDSPISQLSPSVYSIHFLTGFEDATSKVLKQKGEHMVPASRKKGYVGYAEDPTKDAYRQGYNLALSKAIIEEGVNEEDAQGDWRTWMWKRWTGTEW